MNPQERARRVLDQMFEPAGPTLDFTVLPAADIRKGDVVVLVWHGDETRFVVDEMEERDGEIHVTTRPETLT